MTDAKGRELHVGDKALVPCTVTGECGPNVTLEPVATAPQSDPRASIGLHPRQVLRAEPGDDVTHEVVSDGEARIIR